MEIRRLAVDGAFEFTPAQYHDDRGSFLEWFRHDKLAELAGHGLSLAQANCSVSAAGVVRGVHFADVPPGQAKYVTCVRGAVFDVVVDLRAGSPTFGSWESVILDDDRRRAVYIGEGLGHAFMALDDDSTVVYLCSTPYDPRRERAVQPLDPALGIDWPTHGLGGRPITPTLSARDMAAPTLAESVEAAVLPHAETVAAFLRNRGAQGSPQQ